ncbi:MAG: iron-containing alcohol dehydrogenase [Alphaproteobacteria bacterium]|nr:iron-containing alcohol dehydrogenase [Alphaproteobacteria bacterium]
MAFISARTLYPSTLDSAEIMRCDKILEGLRISIANKIHWAEAFATLGWKKNTAIIYDSNTWLALGKDISQALTAQGYSLVPIDLGIAPHADMNTVQHICQQAAPCDAMIAIGSGTINDLVKYSAHELRKPYAICATAPSMNGYLSVNSAISEHGHKKSLPASLPCAALFDVSVISNAPDRLKHAGIGDSLCRSTAQADWLLSHYLLNTFYDALPFKLLQPYEQSMIDGDDKALITTLLLSGLGMSLCGGSYPASQGEHLLAHYIDMRFPQLGQYSFHGEQIAITTIFMASLQQSLLTMEAPPLWQTTLPERGEVLQRFGEETGQSVWLEWQAKCAAIGDVEHYNRHLAANWQDIRQKITEIILPVDILARSLEYAGAPTHAQAIRWTPEQFREAAHNAHLIRNRFTFLDLAMLSQKVQ